MSFDPVTINDVARSQEQARTRDQAKTIFAQTMFLVAVTLGFSTAGAYIGRDLSGGVALVCFIAAIVATFALAFARTRPALGMTVLFGVGLLLGLGIGPTIAAYLAVENGAQIVGQAAGATGLFVAGFGAYGYATRRDLSSWARWLFIALLGLIGFSIVLLFVSIPGGHVIWAVLGLVVFAAYTMFDFNRLRRANPDDVIWIACSIFLDVFNVFLFMLSLLGGRD